MPPAPYASSLPLPPTYGPPSTAVQPGTANPPAGATAGPPPPYQFWSDALAKVLLTGNVDSGVADEYNRRGTAWDVNQDKKLDYANDVAPLSNKDIAIVLPALDEVPKSCESNCADIARIKREQCAVLRKRVGLWLKKNNCPSNLGPAGKKKAAATPAAKKKTVAKKK